MDSSNDNEKRSSNTKKMQSCIIHPSGKNSHNNVAGETGQSSQMRVLSRKDGKGTVSDDVKNGKVRVTIS